MALRPFVVLIAVLSATTTAVRAAGPTWGDAAEVPGSATLNIGGNATVESISCAKAGFCAAGGYFTDSSGHHRPFVVSEKTGVWGDAVEVQGSAAFNLGGDTRVVSISCPRQGYCAAGGYYHDDSTGWDEAFVVSQANWVWGQAIKVAGSSSNLRGGNAEVTSISCGSAGFCAAGGFYTDNSNNRQAFVADEKTGIWGKAKKVPGTPKLNIGGNATVNSVSCPTKNACAAGGSYFDGSRYGAFVAEKTGGVWRSTVEVPGSRVISHGNSAEVQTISCSAPGSCAAGGWIVNRSVHLQAFVANENRGVWQKAIDIPGSAALGPVSEVRSISCVKGGSCAAGGSYSHDGVHTYALLADAKQGAWRKAIAVRSSPDVDVGVGARVDSVSCARAGYCTAGGHYTDGSGRTQAFLVNETSGTWRRAVEVPGLKALSVSGGQVLAVSCTKTGACAAGGAYADDSSHDQAFVTAP